MLKTVQMKKTTYIYNGITRVSFLLLLLFSIFIISCNGQQTENKPHTKETDSRTALKDIPLQKTQPLKNEYSSPFLQPEIDIPISEFVRRIFQDKSGNLWFGTNGDGVVRYNGTTLDYFSIDEGFGGVAVRGIIEDKDGNIWFGTERGLTKYDGNSFVNFTEKDGLNNGNVWSLFMVKTFLIFHYQKEHRITIEVLPVKKSFTV